MTSKQERLLLTKSRKIRDLPKVPNRGYLDGAAQQEIADFLKVGYAIVNAVDKKATLYVANRKPPEELRWAVLLQYSSQHVEPLATRGGLRCGLLTYDGLHEFMNSIGVAIVQPPDGETIVLSSDDEDGRHGGSTSSAKRRKKSNAGK